MGEYNEAPASSPGAWNPFEAPMGHMSASGTASISDFRQGISGDVAEAFSRPETYTYDEPVAPPPPPIRERTPVAPPQESRTMTVAPPAESYLPRTIAEQLGIDPETANSPAGAPKIHVFGTPERVNAFVDRLTDQVITEIAHSKPIHEPGGVNVLVFDNGIVADKETSVPGGKQANTLVTGDVMDFVDNLPDPNSRAAILSSWEDQRDRLGADVFWREISKRCITQDAAPPNLKTISDAALAVKGLIQFKDIKISRGQEERLLGGLRDSDTPFPESLSSRADKSAAVLSNIVANQTIAAPEVTSTDSGGPATVGVIKINRHPNIDYPTQLQAFNKLASRFTSNASRPDIAVIREGNAVDSQLAESFRRQGVVTIVTHTKDDNFIEQVAGQANSDVGANNSCVVVAGQLGVSMAEQVSDVIGKEFGAYPSSRSSSTSASVTLGSERNSATLGSDSNRTEAVESRPAVPVWELTGNEGIIIARENRVTKVGNNGQPEEYDPYHTQRQPRELPAYTTKARNMRPQIMTLEQLHKSRDRGATRFTTKEFFETCIGAWQEQYRVAVAQDEVPRMFEEWLLDSERDGMIHPRHVDRALKRWRRQSGL